MATHAHTTPDRRPATPPGTGGRRRLAAGVAVPTTPAPEGTGAGRRGIFGGAVGLAMTVAAITLPTPANPDPGAVVLNRLVACLDRLLVLDPQLEAQLRVTNGDPDDPDAARMFDAMDTELSAAAAIRPVCRRGFAVKARIAQQWCDWAEGDAVGASLLLDMMAQVPA